jgi:hypothetical protein
MTLECGVEPAVKGLLGMIVKPGVDSTVLLCERSLACMERLVL